jgi:hypothetical protein
MNTRILAVLLALAAPAAAKEAAKMPTPAQAVAQLVQFVPPKGWSPRDYANAGGADPVASFEDGEDRIVARAFGAPGSDYKTPADFLAGPAALTMGMAPTIVGKVVVAGQTLTLYKRGFPINLGDPHIPSPPKPMMGVEKFCVLPLSGGRFVALSYARSSPLPDLERTGEKAWESFLKSVKPAGGKKKKKT